MATPMTLQALASAGNATAVKATEYRAARRLAFVDNLRTFLTILVVVFHLAITYGADGSWYYVERPVDEVTGLALSIWLLLNQWFFMGLFFLISGYFVPQALARKGTRGFLRDRMVRLGIPLVAFTLLGSPVVEYVKAVQRNGFQGTLVDHALATWSNLNFAPGPLWFVETLLVFCLLYALGHSVVRRLGSRQSGGGAIALSHRLMVAFALAIGLAAFATRLVMPVGDEWAHLQLGFYPQYAAMFAAGILARRNNWLPQIPPRIGRVWTTIAIAAIVALPLLLGAGNASDSFAPFAGGLTWQSAATSLWEGFYTLGMAVLLLGLFRRRFPHEGRVARAMSANAYTAYIIHPLVIIPLAMVLSPVALFPLLKWVVVTPVAVALCFLVSHHIVRRIPQATKVL